MHLLCPKMLRDPLFLFAINCQLQILVSVIESNQKKNEEISGEIYSRQCKTRMDFFEGFL